MNAMVLRLITATVSFWMAGGIAEAHDQSVSITFTGHCPEMRPQQSQPHRGLGTTEPKGTASVSFSLSCNADYHFWLSSQNGGLTQTRGRRPRRRLLSPSSPMPFPFTLEASASRNDDRCRSSTMRGPFPSCSGLARANVPTLPSQNASLGFSWDFSGSVPLSGSYRDTLLLTVGPGF